MRVRYVLEDRKKGITIRGHKITNSRYADDIAPFAASKKGLIELKLKKMDGKYRLQVNQIMFKIMITDRMRNNQPRWYENCRI